VFATWKKQTVSTTFYSKSLTILKIWKSVHISRTKCYFLKVPRPNSRKTTVNIRVRYICTRFLIFWFLISGQYSSENNFCAFWKVLLNEVGLYNIISLCEQITALYHLFSKSYGHKVLTFFKSFWKFSLKKI
jgi:hypothetical protein